MSDEEIERLGGSPRWKINEADKALENRIINVERYLWPNGQPDLAASMRAYTDALVAHKLNNALQAVSNATTITDLKLDKMDLALQQMRTTGEDRHEENKGNFKATSGKIDKLIWFGFVTALAAAGTLAMQLFGHHV